MLYEVITEIHWDSKKITHFELVNKLLESEGLKEFVLDSLKRILERFDTKSVEQIVVNVDKEIVDLGNSNFLPKERKELVLKLLTLRLNKLREIYSHHK